ncbi:carbohydrate ABC transporter membrane protein 2 (CUT1 family) [Anaerobacterium chartisolvens]|uniref:Carbohydrate ABC transporter membrane protein 2 (CUT1 family) n=1 Tax=Anaerobacterium chartisolvens TaxID=1297424 RepID=A0A369AVA1_9FIRM|nr:carbohydrate ABC transporter permease [Anaerobacterium chartisolvens]RCX12993.1 carbohydrate ABC transporter membrane protein 2 (CUT1 family) [Anaerobacterium chartisolvens]
MNSSINLMRRVRTLLLEASLWICSLTIIAPLMIVFMGSFKTNTEVLDFSLKLPSIWHIKNYLTVIEKGNLVRYFYNSVLIAAFSVTITVILSSMVGFIVARRVNRLTGFVFMVFFIGLITPQQIIPTIKLLQGLKIYGTIPSVILLHAAYNCAFSVFMYTGFVKSVSREIDESALMDGASTLRLFFSIIFPLTKPINITLVIFAFLGIWNDITLPIYFINDSNNWTMPLSAYKFFSQYSRDWNLVFADMVLISLPVFLVYIFGQRYIVSGLTAGSVKG